MTTSRFVSALLCCSLLAFGCGGGEKPGVGAVGTASMALTATGSGGTAYALQNARVRFTGPTTTTIMTDPTEELLEVDLTPADYSVQLLTGWQLVRIDGGGPTMVPATLVSQNPVNISIVAGQTSSVDFVFDVSGELIPFGLGRARVSISVFEGTGGAAGMAGMGGMGGGGGGDLCGTGVTTADPICTACVDTNCCGSFIPCWEDPTCQGCLTGDQVLCDSTSLDEDLFSCWNDQCSLECGGF